MAKQNPQDPKASTALVPVKRGATVSRRPNSTWSRKSFKKPPTNATTRARFIHYFEECEGNVTMACKLAGINRRTYYRWIDSQTEVNKKFRKALARTFPQELALDRAEAVVQAEVQQGENRLKAAMYVLDNKGASRGYGSAHRAIVKQQNVMISPQAAEQGPEAAEAEAARLERVAEACMACISKYQDKVQTMNDRWNVVGQFAERAKVDRNQLAERCGLVVDVEVQNTEVVQ